MDINTNMNNKKVIDTINYNGKYVDVDVVKKKAAYAIAMLIAMASALVLFFL
ncbi:hypothetical protein [Butyrivibrio sp. FCS014]|uniref:hypothetical protein n=1 Tax=Butyrivibrio sp. FCS014 TaxID=1408304 RepID=UPI0004B88A8A|nr:hypothetical protein [Butyrivibrio sp. FCS014]